MKKTSALAALCTAALIAGVSAGYAGKIEPSKKVQKEQKEMFEEDCHRRSLRFESRYDDGVRVYRVVKHCAPTNAVDPHLCNNGYVIKTTKGVRLTTGPGTIDDRYYARDVYDRYDRYNRYERRHTWERTDWIPESDVEPSKHYRIERG